MCQTFFAPHPSRSVVFSLSASHIHNTRLDTRVTGGVRILVTSPSRLFSDLGNRHGQ
jgi:hypothetical protein